MNVRHPADMSADAKFVYECWQRAEAAASGEAAWHYRDAIRHAVLLLTGTDLRNDLRPGCVDERFIRELLPAAQLRAVAALLELADDPPWPRSK